MDKTWKQRCLPMLLLLTILSADTNHNNIIFLRQTAADGVTPEEATHLRDEVVFPPSLLFFLKINLPLLLFYSIWNIINEKPSSSFNIGSVIAKAFPLSFITPSIFSASAGLRELLFFILIINKFYMFWKFDPAHLLFNLFDECIYNHTDRSSKHCSIDKILLCFFFPHEFWWIAQLWLGNSINYLRREIKKWFFFFFMGVMCFCWWYDIGSWNVLSCF